MRYRIEIHGPIINLDEEDSYPSEDTFSMKMYITVEPLYNEVIGITNIFFNPSNGK